MRRLPSKANGLVTTATVSAPISLASEAMIGVAPVPVPPPRPAVTKIMSAPSRASMILSESSRAALRPISGLAPAPRPLVSFTPSWILVAARDIRRACRSVLATMNSMCSMPASIMRLTALLPPPPTPITLMRASLRASSLKLMRSPLSSFMVSPRKSVSRCSFLVARESSQLSAFSSQEKQIRSYRVFSGADCTRT